MNGLDLFSGIGGITKALEGYVTPVAYCENDRYAQGVLLSRMATGDLPMAPIWDDIRTLAGTYLPSVDIIYGGFPCQDISVAGRGEGLEGKRSGLFFEVVRLIGEIRPRFVFLENVPVITCRGGGRVVSELTALGYDSRWGLLSAADVGANHIRDRWWLLAHARHGCGRHVGTFERGKDQAQKRCGDHDAAGRQSSESEPLADASSEQSGGLQLRTVSSDIRRNGEDVAYAAGGRCRQEYPDAGRTSQRTLAPKEWGGPPDGGWWETEPPVGRLVDGIPFRMGQLRALGNSVVPAQAREAFERLLGLK